jgi:hypothetical protein
MNLRTCLCLAGAMLLAGCNGISAARIVTNSPADVTVDGQFKGPAPVTIPVPWRNVDNIINFAQRKVTITVDGAVVWEKEISSTIYQKSLTGDFVDGSQFGTGRTYTIMVDVRAATRPATQPP